jgi:tetratricopeptide (TPR) repeat protein
LALSTGQLPQEYAQSDPNSSSQSGAVYFNQAADAFSAGKYRDAVRLANHAAVESPQNPKAPELMSLALFALGDYRGAAAQAHAALALGPPADWATVYGYYGNLDTYTKQLRDLEKYSNDKPTAPEAHFLRAYQCLLLGYPKQAVKEFEEVVKLAPQDKLAAELLKKYSGNPTPESAPTPPAPMPIEQ